MSIRQPHVQTTATENMMRTTLLCSTAAWWNSVLQGSANLWLSAVHIQYDEAAVMSVCQGGSQSSLHFSSTDPGRDPSLLSQPENDVT